MHTPGFGSAAAQITQPAKKAATPVAPLTAGDWHRSLLRLRHQLGVDRREERNAVEACEGRNREYFDLLFGMAEAAVGARGVDHPASLSDFLHQQPIRKTLDLAYVGEGRWIARERACEASALARGEEYGPEVKRFSDSMNRLIYETSPQYVRLQNAYGRRVHQEKVVEEAEGELRYARVKDWKRSLSMAATCGWVSFVGVVLVSALNQPEVPIGAAPGGSPVESMPSASPVFLLLPLAFAVVATAGLLWMKRILRTRDGGHKKGPPEVAAS